MRTPFDRVGSAVVAISAFLALGATPAAAQFALRHTTLGKAVIRDDDAPSEGEPVKAGMNIVDVELGFPLLIRPEDGDGRATFAGGSLELRRHDFRYEGATDTSPFRPDRTYGLSLGFVLVRKHGPRWTTVAFAGSGIFSDFEEVEGGDFLYNGGLFFVRNLGTSWQIGAGLVATYAFGDPLVLPVPYVNYVGRGKLLLDLQMPDYLLVGYRFSPRFEAGLAAQLVYDNYTLGDPSARDADGGKPSVVFSDVAVGPQSRIMLAGPVRLDIALARTVHRTLDTHDANGDTLFSRKLDQTWMLTAALSLVGLGPEE